MTLLYTITTYPPSIGGAQLQMHEFARRLCAQEPIAVAYHWECNRTDWLRGTTLNGPPAEQRPPLDGVARYRVSLDEQQRKALKNWVRLYWLLQNPALERISDSLLLNLRSVIPALLATPPRLIHNSRIGREGLSLASLKLARALDVPFVLTPNHHHHWRGWLYRHFLKLYREADAVTVYTQTEREELIRLGVNSERIHVVGVGPLLADHGDGARFRQTYNIPQDAPIVLFLGQKYAYKRFSLLLEVAPKVWKKFPTTRFVFIGPRTDASRKIFGRMRESRIIESDSVDLQTKTDALAACDVLCVPSSRESFGGVYLEAWLMGKPVIGGDAPALREVIAEGERGFRVSADVDLLAKCIITLLADGDLRDAFGRAGQQFANQFTWPLLLERLNTVYATIR